MQILIIFSFFITLLECNKCENKLYWDNPYNGICTNEEISRVNPPLDVCERKNTDILHLKDSLYQKYPYSYFSNLYDSYKPNKYTIIELNNSFQKIVLQPIIFHVRTLSTSLGYLLFWVFTGNPKYISTYSSHKSSSPSPSLVSTSYYVTGSKYPPDAKHKFDFAGLNAGARIVAASPAIQHVNAIQKRDLDSYMLVPCSETAWYIIALNTQINLRAVAISVHEAYSSTFQLIEIYGSNIYPSNNWELLAVLVPDADRSCDYFSLETACTKVGSYSCWIRFMKVNLINNEPNRKHKYCTLTRFQVFGSDILESLDSKLKKDIRKNKDCNLIKTDFLKLDNSCEQCSNEELFHMKENILQLDYSKNLDERMEKDFMLENSILSSKTISTISFDSVKINEYNKDAPTVNSQSSPSLLNLLDRITALEKLTATIVNTTNEFLVKYNQIIRFEQFFLLNKYNTLNYIKHLYNDILNQIKVEKKCLDGKSDEIVLWETLTYKSLCSRERYTTKTSESQPLHLMTKAELCAALKSRLIEKASFIPESMIEKRHLMRLRLREEINRIQFQKPIIGGVISVIYFFTTSIYTGLRDSIEKLSKIIGILNLDILSSKFTYLHQDLQSYYTKKFISYSLYIYSVLKICFTVAYNFLLIKGFFYLVYYIEKWSISLFTFLIYIIIEITVDRILLLSLIYFICYKIQFRRQHRLNNRIRKSNASLIKPKIVPKRNYRVKKLETLYKSQVFHRNRLRHKSIVVSHPVQLISNFTSQYATSN